MCTYISVQYTIEKYSVISGGYIFLNHNMNFKIRQRITQCYIFINTIWSLLTHSYLFFIIFIPLFAEILVEEGLPMWYCEIPVTWSQRGVCCDECGVWHHKSCEDIGTKEMEHLEGSYVVWYCCICKSVNI